jgi:hypothetical protein
MATVVQTDFGAPKTFDFGQRCSQQQGLFQIYVQTSKRLRPESGEGALAFLAMSKPI